MISGPDCSADDKVVDSISTQDLSLCDGYDYLLSGYNLSIIYLLYYLSDNRM